MKTIVKQLSFFVVIFCFVLLQNTNAQNYATISVDSAQLLIQYHVLDPNFIILDVRTESEYSSMHLENGVNLNYYLTTFDQILDTLIKDKVYLVHCASGSRSASVFSSMQTKGFTDVFNMSGGINAWNSAAKPVVTSVAPILLSVSDSLVDFQDVQVGLNDVKSLVITNYGNDTLDFLSITDLAGTPFSANFNIGERLTGLMDYSFQIFYNPTVNQSDSVVFRIESEGGSLEFILLGTGSSLSIISPMEVDLMVYPNPTKGSVRLEHSFPFSVEVLDANGRLIARDLSLEMQKNIDLSEQKKGIYFLRIKSINTSMVRKIILQ